MSKEKDIVSDILQRVELAVRTYLETHLQGTGGLEQGIADELAAQIRAQDTPVRQYWGKTEPYVAARPPSRAEARQRAVEEASRSGKVAEAGRRHGISRATMYRLLKRD